MLTRGVDESVFSVNLDAWRLILIILVVVNHCFLLGIGNWSDLNGFERGAVALTFASVPALSLFSGYLLSKSRDTSAFGIILQKFRTIVVPFLFWNTAIFFLIVLINRQFDISDSHLFMAVSKYYLLNGAIGFYAAPANEPLYFLRDLFVCICLFSIIRNFLRKFVYLSVAIVIFTLNYFYDFDRGIILRNTIPLFFLIGCAIAIFPAMAAIAKRALIPLSVCAAALIVFWSFSDATWTAYSPVELVTLLVCSFLVIGLAGHPWFGHRAADWGRRFSFTIFLSHWWTLLLLQNLWRARGWSDWSFLLLGSVTAVAAGVVLASLISRLPVPIPAILTGDRVRKGRPARTLQKA